MKKEKTKLSIKDRLIYLGIGLISALIIFLLSWTSFIERAELLALDTWFKLRGKAEMLRYIGSIDIDETALATVGRWPWPRNKIANLIETLNEYNTDSVFFDIFFPEPGLSAIDKTEFENKKRLLEKILKENKDNKNFSKEVINNFNTVFNDYDNILSDAIKNNHIVYLSQFFIEAPQEEYPDLKSLTEETGKVQKKFSADRKKSYSKALKYSIPFKLKNYKYFSKSINVFPPISKLFGNEKGLGFAQIVTDIDGTVRKYPLVMYYNKRLWFSAALIMAMDKFEVSFNDLEFHPGKVLLIKNAVVSKKPLIRKNISIPIDKRCRMLVNWAGPYKNTFIHIPFTLVTTYYVINKIKENLSAEDINNINLDVLIQKIQNKKLTNPQDVPYYVYTLYNAKIFETILESDPSLSFEFISQAMGIEADTNIEKIFYQVKMNNKILEIINNDKNISNNKILEKVLDEYNFKKDKIIQNILKIKNLINKGLINKRRPLYFFDEQTIEIGNQKTTIDSLDFANKIFFCGLTATGTHDLNPMPYEPRYPMVGLHINAFNTILTGQFLHFHNKLRTFFICILLGLFLGIIIPEVRPIIGFITIILLSVATGLFAYILFSKFNIWFNSVTPIGSIVLSSISILVFRYVSEEKEKKKIKNAFSTYMTPTVVNEILANPDKLKLGGEKRIMTVYFSDLSGFTTISEKLSPEELVALLNEYLEEMTNIIFKYEGTLDKYEGDAIMAFWNAPLTQEDHAKRCCFAAIDCWDKLLEMQKKWLEEGMPPLTMRIGINTGYMVVGNMGSKTRMDYTVMGDSVNLGARLESANKPYKTHLMMSEYTKKYVENDIEYRQLDSLIVKGKTKPVDVFEVIAKKGNLTKEQEKLISSYNEAFILYRKMQFEKALKDFRLIQKEFPEDGPVQVYIERCSHFIKNPPGENWDGTFTLTSK